MTVQELREKRSQVAKKMKDLHSLAEKEERQFTEEEESRWDAGTKEIDDIDKQIERREFLDAQTEAETPDPLAQEREEREQHEFRGREENRPLTSIERSRAFRYWIAGSRCSYAEQEADRQCYERSLQAARRQITAEDGVAPANSTGVNLRMHRPFGAPQSIQDVRDHQKRWNSMDEAEKRDLVTGTANLGGNLIPDEMMKAIEIALIHTSSMRQHATIQSTATGADLPIPTVNDTANDGRWLAENTAVTETDPTFGQIVLSAHKASGDMVPVSLELLQDSATNLPSLIGRLLFERIGRLTNAAYTVGDDSAKPNGIVTAAADSSVSGAITYDNLIDLFHSVDIAYRGNASFMMHDSLVADLRKVKSTDGVPLWTPSVVAGEPDRFNGAPVVINNDMPTGSSAKGVIFGDLSKYLIRDVMDFLLIRLDERYMEFLRVAFLAVMRTDGELIDAGTNPVKYMTLPA